MPPMPLPLSSAPAVTAWRAGVILEYSLSTWVRRRSSHWPHGRWHTAATMAAWRRCQRGARRRAAVCFQLTPLALGSRSVSPTAVSQDLAALPSHGGAAGVGGGAPVATAAAPRRAGPVHGGPSLSHAAGGRQVAVADGGWACRRRRAARLVPLPGVTLLLPLCSPGRHCVACQGSAAVPCLHCAAGAVCIIPGTVCSG